MSLMKITRLNVHTLPLVAHQASPPPTPPLNARRSPLANDLVDENAYMMIQRKKLTIHINVKKNTPVIKLKKMVGCILKTSKENIQLHYKNAIMVEQKLLSDYFDSSTCLVPVSIGLALKMDNEEFESLDIVSCSIIRALMEN
ncbi:hypothetical protein QTP88_020515 [Uroleucon formosanum]